MGGRSISGGSGTGGCLEYLLKNGMFLAFLTDVVF